MLNPTPASQRLEHLLDAHLDGRLTPLEGGELVALLADPANRRHLLRLTRLHGALLEAFGDHERGVYQRTESPYAWSIILDQQQHLSQAVTPSGRLAATPANPQPRRLWAARPWSSGGPVLAAAALVLVAVGWWLLRPGTGSSDLPISRQPLTVTRADRAVAVPAGIPLHGGDRIQGAVSLSWSDGTTLEGSSSADLVLAGGRGKQLRLAAGTMRIEAAKQPAGQPLVIDTAQARAEVVGTRFALAVEQGRTALAVEHGAVRFASRDGSESTLVTEGRQRATIGAGVPVVETFGRALGLAVTWSADAAQAGWGGTVTGEGIAAIASRNDGWQVTAPTLTGASIGTWGDGVVLEIDASMRLSGWIAGLVTLSDPISGTFTTNLLAEASVEQPGRRTWRFTSGQFKPNPPLDAARSGNGFASQGIGKLTILSWGVQDTGLVVHRVSLTSAPTR